MQTEFRTFITMQKFHSVPRFVQLKQWIPFHARAYRWIISQAAIYTIILAANIKRSAVHILVQINYASIRVPICLFIWTKYYRGALLRRLLSCGTDFQPRISWSNMAEISNKLGLKQHLYHECKVAEHLEIFDISRNFICGVLVCFLQNKWSGHSVEWTPNCSNSSHLQAGLEAHPGIWAKQATISVYHKMKVGDMFPLLSKKFVVNCFNWCGWSALLVWWRMSN